LPAHLTRNKLPNGNMDIVDSKALGEAVRLARKRLKVTQKDLALASGTGLRFIIELEKGKPTCHLGKALGILQALGLRLKVVES
jgi:HTH-type transcriptional regulator / antitoxin HipB